ncbi:MAG: acyl-CoA thioesterase, partial [Actinomycetota bacterium]|nr:acyl-CoA thioesterase [Actinomycetota bacterium]
MHEKRIEIRWRDLDAAGHVNNAVYVTYVEEAQAALLARILPDAQPGDPPDFVTARVAIDYREELRLADRAVVGRSTVVRVGESSVTARSELYAAAGHLVAEAETVLV